MIARPKAILTAALMLLVTLAPRSGAQSLVPSAPRLGGYFQAREVYQDKAGLSASLNRARISADGALPNRFSYRFLAEFEASGTARTPATVSLREAIVQWKLAPCGLSFGQMKAPFSREYLILVSAYDLADLPADGIPPHRLWYPDRLNFFVVGYNTDKVKRSELPATYEGFLDP